VTETVGSESHSTAVLKSGTTPLQEHAMTLLLQ